MEAESHDLSLRVTAVNSVIGLVNGEALKGMDVKSVMLMVDEVYDFLKRADEDTKVTTLGVVQ